MKELISLFPTISFVSQITNQDSYERFGIAGISLGVTVFLWRYFVNKEEKAQEKRDKLDAEEKEERKKREASDTAERNRLLEIQNILQSQVVALLKEQVVSQARVATTLVNSQQEAIRLQKVGQQSMENIAARGVHIGNDERHPIPTIVIPTDS